ncbi:hypothetical protein CL617_00090 [archaeon]|nr:hypothetical protein [archaeon]|tara:strand:+ start:2097 stop:2441 length:345 start_codon:yes stop_codon:yes gene_type:complete
MGLITGYREITGVAYYFLDFEMEGYKFSNSHGQIIEDGISNPEQVLNIAKKLIKAGITPNISRSFTYTPPRKSFKISRDDSEELSIERLEEIVDSGDENLPKFKEPIVSSTYRN